MNLVSEIQNTNIHRCLVSFKMLQISLPLITALFVTFQLSSCFLCQMSNDCYLTLFPSLFCQKHIRVSEVKNVSSLLIFAILGHGLLVLAWHCGSGHNIWRTENWVKHHLNIE